MMVRMERNLLLVVTVAMLLCIGGALAGANDEQPLVNTLFFETDIREALSEISMQTGVNIIPDQTVSGVVTVDLQDVPLEQALRMILIGGGYTFRKIDDGFYFVGLPDPRNVGFGELVESEVVALENVTVGEVKAIMPGFLTDYVHGDQSSRVLSITAPPAELERIKALIGQVDRPRKQVEISVIITEISSSAMKDIGIGAGGSMTYEFQEGQVWNDDWVGSLGFGGQLLSLAFDGYGALQLALKALEDKNEAKIHADPRVVVADGQSAQLFIGEEQILLLGAEGEGATTTRVERVEVGVTIRVTPTVVGDRVILEIAPELSNFTTASQTGAVVKQSSLTTTVSLSNGQTAVLGGMTLQETSESQRKIPILGDIPILRWLFRNDTSREADKELLIFVTPVIQ